MIGIFNKFEYKSSSWTLLGFPHLKEVGVFTYSRILRIRALKSGLEVLKTHAKKLV